MVNLWSDPNGLYKWTAMFMIRLMRSNRIYESFLLVLCDWIPAEIQSEWENFPSTPQFQVCCLFWLIVF